MDEAVPVSAGSPTPVQRVGELLRATRERQGLSLAEVAARTRVPMRHLEAIEANDYSGLPSTTYATGFARAYARSVGADEVEVARGVRTELAGTARPVREFQPYEPADPSRVPSRGLALTTMALAFVVLIGAGLWFATNLFRGGTSQAVPPPATAAAQPAPVPAPTPAAGGQVLITATDDVWLRLYDSSNKTLHQGLLKAGEHFEVPADAVEPMMNVGRPDKLRITVNGSQLQGLDLGDTAVKDVRVSAAALTARASGQPAPAASPTAAPGVAQVAPSSGGSRPDRPRRAASRPRDETARANLESAAAPPSGNAQ